MGIELAKAYIVVKADASKLKGGLDNVKKQTTSAISSIGTQLKGMLAGLGVVSVGAIFAGAGREAAKFEDTMVFVRANARLLGKEGKAAFQEIETAVRKMGSTTRFTAVQSAEAMNQLVLGGLNAKEAIGALPAVLNLAASSGMGMAESAKIIVDNMIKYGMAAKDTGIIADFLSSAQSRAQITARDLASAHQSLASIAAQMGASFLEVTAILTAMGKSGEDMNRAGTALAMALARLTANSGPAAEALKKMGIEISNFQKPGGGIDLIPLFREISDSMPEDPIKRAAKAIEIFGIKGKSMLGIFGLMRRGKFVEETAKGLKDDIGRAAKIATARMSTFIGILLKAKSALSEFAIAALTPVLKAMEPMIGVITKMTGVMSFVVKKFTALNESTGGLIGRIVIATVGTLAFVKAIRLIGPAARLAGIAIRIATLSSGWFAIVAVIGTVIGAIATLITWLKKTDGVQKALAASAETFRLAWERVKQAFNMIVKAIADGLSLIGGWIAELTGVDIPKLADSIEEMAANSIRFIADFVLNAAEWFIAIMQNWKAIWKIFPSFVKVALSYIMDIFFNVMKALPQIIGFQLGVAFRAFLWFAKQIVLVLWTAIKEIVMFFIRLPKMIYDAVTGKDPLKRIRESLGSVFKDFGKGFAGELPDPKQLFASSKGTKDLFKKEIGPAWDKIVASKRKLEKGRAGLFPSSDEPEAIQAAAVQGEVFGKAAAGPIIDAFRIGFPELGRKIQDALMKKEDAKEPEKQMVGLLKLGNKKQDELIKAVKEDKGAMALT